MARLVRSCNRQSGVFSVRLLNYLRVVAEQRVELPFLDDWEMRLNASIEGGKGNPEAVAMLKEQIRELRDSIASRRAREGKEYWSIYRIETFACHAVDDEAGR